MTKISSSASGLSRICRGASRTGLVALFATGLTLSGAAQQTSFKSSAELVSIDVLATDAQGQPVTDLTAKDFVLKVDGKVRPLQSAQLVRLADPNRTTTPARTGAPALPPPFSTNTDPKGRVFLFVVDHEQIHPGNERQVIEASIRLLDRLAPEDRAAVITMPRGKVEADLTNDRAPVRAALERVIGHAPRPTSRFEFSIKEAMAVLARTEGNDTFTKSVIDEMIARECVNETTGTCTYPLMADARDWGRELVRSARDSVRALNEFIGGLSALEGTKSVIFVSERMIANPDVDRDLIELGRTADLARVRLFVLQVNRPSYDVSRRRAPADEAGDLAMEMTGLENVAGVTGGEMFRPSGRVDSVMTRIDALTSAYYLVGFEPTEKERDGKYHKIQLTLTRPGVTVRARGGFQISERTASTKTDADASPLAAMLRDNLRTYRDLPLRAAAFAYRAAEGDHVKVVVMAGSLGTAPLDGAAIALISESGGQGAEWMATPDAAVGPVITAGEVLPGRYRVRVAASDAIGRQGVVDVRIDAAIVDAGPLQLSSLMAGSVGAAGFRPRFDFTGAAAVSGYLEIYNVPLLAGTPSGVLELAASPDGPALATAPMAIAATSNADRRLAQGTLPLPATLPAGDLVLRARIELDGRPAGTLTRTIRR